MSGSLFDMASERSDGTLTLSQFQTLLGDSIRNNPRIQNVWVVAEFSDLRIVGGHCYLELIEKDAAGRTQAKIRAMIWSYKLHEIKHKFKGATGGDISSGLKVRVRGAATHHNLYGLSFNITDIDPSYTQGDLERLRREILERLAKEGVAGINRSLEVPVAPQRIAVISAAGAAGYGDFINQIEGNTEGFRFYPFLFPAVMQGDRTVPSVMKALDIIEETKGFWDLVVIIRGGGSTSDLNSFDNLELARRVATFPIPVAVGIGHERDRNVLDELACIRCKTPTAVAAWLIESLRSAYSRAFDAVSRIARYGTDAMRGEHIRLTNMRQTIPALARARLMEHKMKLAQLSQSIPALVRDRIMRQRLMLSSLAARIERDAASGLNNEGSRLGLLARRIEADVTSISQRETMRLQRLEDMLRLLSPENTLRRGYTITRVNGHAVTDPDDVSPGTVIETTFAGGKLSSTVN